MARANMLVADELRQEFISAQTSGETRWLVASVKDVNINFVSAAAASSDLHDDIERLREVLGKSPMFILFCMDPTLPTKRWILIAYVPEMSRVREKMLYATARDDVKNVLGSSHFKGECHLSEPDDLTDEAIARASVRHATDAPLTKEEKLAQEERQAMPTGPVGGAMASAMSAVPFKVSSKVTKALSGFASGQEANFVVVSVSEKEKIELGCIKTLADGDAIAGELSPTEPRYVVLRRAVGGSDKVYFAYLCPDVSKVRTRMVYSAGKATMIAQLSEAGIEVDSFVEVRDGGEIDDLLREDAVPVAAASVISAPKFAKPARPGRGKARITKKQ